MDTRPATSCLLMLTLALLPACGHRREAKRAASAPAPAPPMVAPAAPPESAVPAVHVGQKVTTASGLRYEVLKVGTGASPKSWDQVRVHYHGYFPDGRVFDSSIERGESIVFRLDQVIPGWTEGVQLMREGAKYRFFIPWLRAYGLQGSPPNIPPKQDLMFDIELIEVLR